MDDKKNLDNFRQNIVLNISYLLGLDRERLKNSFKNVEKIEEALERLDKNKFVRIIRCLAILRFEILIKYKKIREKMIAVVPLNEMHNLIRTDLINELSKYGIDAIKIDKGTSVQFSYLNDKISENIENVKDIFPSWIKWNYIKDIFKIHNCYVKGGKNLKGKNIDKLKLSVKKARDEYHINKEFYPYGLLINSRIKLNKSHGNILLNDSKFLKIIYSKNNDLFDAKEYVIDAKNDTKENIYSFLKNAQNCYIYADCENMDPFKFGAVLKNLRSEKLRKIKKIFLVNDENTTDAWDYLKDVFNIEIENIKTERILENKSLVDHDLVIKVTKAHYENKIDSFIIASSDSDFWSLVKNLENASFLFLIEKDITSKAVIDKYSQNNVPYCVIDDFAQDVVQEYKNLALYKKLLELIKKISKDGIIPTKDAKEFVDKLYNELYIRGAHNQLEKEKEEFYKKYIKPGFIIKPDEEGKFLIELVSKKTA